ncbi:unnamed protein product [Paramecium octaurelia]|uniref:Uncharacterized protein n=1 Tax=Paramecium octaurelia TaxID=43137 RepID=A0A8S1UAA7_PAROT|nr:unnamed protein product [Paramecium octaurelia]
MGFGEGWTNLGKLAVRQKEIQFNMPIMIQVIGQNILALFYKLQSVFIKTAILEQLQVGDQEILNLFNLIGFETESNAQMNRYRPNSFQLKTDVLIFEYVK